MINFIAKRKNRQQRRSEPRRYTIEEALRNWGKKSVAERREKFPPLAECPSCGYLFSELTIYRCLVLSFERQPEIKCLQCNEIYSITNLKKIEEKTNVDNVNNRQ
jgi:hypothetical protein